MTKSAFLAPIPAPGAARRHLARPTDLSMDLSQGDTFPGNLSLGDTFVGNLSLGDISWKSLGCLIAKSNFSVRHEWDV